VRALIGLHHPGLFWRPHRPEGDQVSRAPQTLPAGRHVHGFTITLFRDLIYGLARRGYAWHEKIYHNDSHGLQQGIAEIEQSLDAGMPVTIDTTTGYGHTFAIAGYSVPDLTIRPVAPAQPSPRDSRGCLPRTRCHLELIQPARRRISSAAAEPCPQRPIGNRPYPSSLALSVIFVLYSFDTGHPDFAACTALSNASWLAPGTLATSSR